MQVDAAVAEHTVPRIMPILTPAGIVVKPTGILGPFLGGGTGGPMLPFVMFQGVIQLLLGQLVVGVVVLATIYFCA